MSLDERVVTRLKIDPSLLEDATLGKVLLGVVEIDRPPRISGVAIRGGAYTWIDRRGNHYRWAMNERLEVYTWTPKRGYYSGGWRRSTRRMSLIIKAVYIGAVLAGEVEPFHVT